MAGFNAYAATARIPYVLAVLYIAQDAFLCTTAVRDGVFGVTIPIATVIGVRFALSPHGNVQDPALP